MHEKEYEPRAVRDVEEAAADQEEEQRSDAIELAHRAASKIEPGEPGECEVCGEYFARVVNRISCDGKTSFFACGRCRDELKLG